MSAHTGLKILSGLCLLYIAFVLLTFPLSIVLDGRDENDAVIAMLAALPGITLLVTAYRQLFRQCRGLMSLSVLMLLAANIGTIFLIKYLGASIETFNQSTASDIVMPFPEYTLKDIVLEFLPLYALIVIPVFANFRTREA